MPRSYNGSRLIAAITLIALLVTGVSSLAPAFALASTTLRVGPGEQYALPSQAFAAAHDGDTILIDAGTYTNDFAYITANNVTIKSVGGRAKLVQTQDTIPNDKAFWVTSGNNITIDGIEFTGAKLNDDINGAGIRAEGAGLTILNSYFHDNQEGILTTGNPNSDIVIKNTEFAHNGLGGDGQTHNVYIGNVRSLTFMYNYTHDADTGMDLKSRAQKNVIEYNRIVDSASGSASYQIDLSNGGETYLIGNIIEKGPLSENHSRVVAYGQEGATNAVQQIYAVNNTIIDNSGYNADAINIQGGATGIVMNNLVMGTGKTVNGGNVTQSNNVTATASSFTNAASLDFHLNANSPAINAGADPGSANGISLTPTMQYVDTASSQTRPVVGALDTGAYEYGAATTPVTPPVVTSPAPTSTPATPITTPTLSPTVTISSPSNGATVSGTQTLSASVTGLSNTQYDMYWQVDGDRLNPMQNDGSGKSYAIDYSGWNWRGSGPYTIAVIAKQNGVEIARQTIQIFVSPGSAQPNPISVNVASPQNGATVSGTQTLSASVSGLSPDQYDMYWQVDGDRLNPMQNSGSGKSYDIDYSGWTWRGSGPYSIAVIAKQNGVEIGRQTITIYVAH